MELKYYCEKTRVGVKLSSMFRRNEEYFNSSIDYLTLKEYCTKDSTFGVDLGAIYTLSNYGTTFGATAKNLNSPTFNNGGEEYKIKPSLKVGVSQGFFDNDLKVALDADLTKNKSTFFWN